MDIAAKYNWNTFIDFLSNSFLPQDFQQNIENIALDKVTSNIKRAEKLGFCALLNMNLNMKELKRNLRSTAKQIGAKSPVSNASRWKCAQILKKLCN
jgi:hypothetical protein